MMMKKKKKKKKKKKNGDDDDEDELWHQDGLLRNEVSQYLVSEMKEWDQEQEQEQRSLGF